MRLPDPFKGHVYFVGAGPGDPGLITMKGAHYLSRANVILHDDLLDQRLLDLAPTDCEKIYVGKRGGRSSCSQDQINELLVEHGRRGGVVVRLKGGDPFVFGRGGEEALALVDAGIPFEIVSGVTAAAGVPAYAGIPLTHRGIAAAAVLVTGQEDPTRTTPAVDWAALAQLESTLVIYMGTRKLEAIAAILLEHGRAPETPVAMIERGTWPGQRTVTTRLDQVTSTATQAGIRSPALIVVGGVVALRETLDWYEQKPLFGRRLLITRSREQTGDLQLLLEAHGAQVAALPMLDIGPPADYVELDLCLRDLGRFAWVAFTSPNGVDFFFERLYQLGLDARALATASVAAVGLATGEHLRDRGLQPDLVPKRQSQDGLIEAFAGIDLSDSHILLPASPIARPDLAEALELQGAAVQQVTAYANQPAAPSGDDLRALADGHVDMAIFASPSSLHNLWSSLGAEALSRLAGIAIACIGPTTAGAAADYGLDVAVQPATSSMTALVEAICNFYRGSI